jgi:hypothetical protein
LVAVIATLSIALLATCGRALAQVATTTVQDTVYRADGTQASGAVVVSWPTFTTAAGQAVAAGNTSATIGPNGALSIALTPNAGATPAGTYYTAVLHLDDGTTSQQYWVIPVSATPVTLASIENQVLPTSVAMQTASRAYVDAAIAQVTGGTQTTGTTTYVPTTGGTMTGPLVLPGDPVTPTQAADKHYVDTNVTALAAGVGQKVSMVPTATQTVSQPTGTQLQVNALNGELYASQFQSGDGGGGIANALAACGSESGCQVVADPSYTNEPVIPTAIPEQGRVVDQRNGADTETFWNPANASPGSIGETFNQYTTTSDANSSVAGSGIGTTRLTLSTSNTVYTGGSNQNPANVESAPYQKANYGVASQTGSYFTAGQHVQDQHVINCYAVGDCLEGSWYLTNSGGYRDIADEGAHPFDLQVAEDWHSFQGTCASGCTTGSTSVMVTATFGGGTQGDGRYLIDKNPAKTITAGQLVSAGGNVFPIANFTGTSFPVSVFLQTTAAATSQPKDIAPGTLTLPIATSGVPAGFAVNTNQLPGNSGVACVADIDDSRFPNYEQANYTVVDASHITLTLNKVHGAGAVIAVGGLCGYGIEQTVDTMGAIRQVFPVVGSINATSLYYAGALTPVVGFDGNASTSGFLNVSGQIASLARTNNVVTATLSGSLPVDVNGLTMTVSGAADASYNGSFAVTTTNGNKLTYADTGPNSTSSGGTVSIVTGGYVLYPMAEVLSVYDAATKQVDGLLHLGANAVAWAPGDALEEPHYYQNLTAADTEFITQYMPRPIQFSTAGKQYAGQVGPGTRGWQIQNAVPPSNYLGAGGTHQLPDDAYVAEGPWKIDFEVDAGTNALIYAHCNLHGCNRWDSGYSLFEMDSASGVDSLFYSPQASAAVWNLGGQSFTFSPSGFSANAITTGPLSAGPVTATSVSTSGTSLKLSQTGDTYGATSLSLENRNGLNGALFQNAGLELVDFGFLDSASYQNNLRSTSGVRATGYNNANGEFDFLLNATSLGGVPSTSALFLGIDSAQFYPSGSGQVSINVPGGTNPNAALAVNGSMSVGTYAGTKAAPANGLIVSGSVGVGSASPAGLLSVGANNQFQVDGSGDVTARQIVGSGATPTITVGSGAGTGASATITGTTISGVISLTTGTSTVNSAAAANVAWTLSAATPPQGCSLMPRNAAAAAATGTIFTGAPSGSGWTVNVGATALAASTSYSWTYQCF